MAARAMTVKICTGILMTSAVLTPFFMGIAPAPMTVWMAFLAAAFVVIRLVSRQPLFPRLAINLPLWLFFAITCISIVHSVDYGDTWKGGILRLAHYALIIYAVATGVRTRKTLLAVVIGACAGASLASIDAGWQVIFGKDFIRGYTPVINLGIVRATAAFKDSNLLGIYLSGIAPVAIGLGFWFFKGKARAAAIVAALLIVAGIGLTYSRPTFLALYIALAMFALARRQKWLLIALAACLVIAPFAAPKSVKEWAKSVDYNPLRFMCNDDRIAIYRNALQMIRQHPVMGVGANTFMKNYRFYKEKPEYREVITADYCYAHNNFLHMAGELGLAGVAVFLWFLVVLFRESLRIYRRLQDPLYKTLSLSLIICLASFLINGLTESSLYYARVAGLFWFLAGWSLAMGNFVPREAAR